MARRLKNGEVPENWRGVWKLARRVKIGRARLLPSRVKIGRARLLPSRTDMLKAICGSAGASPSQGNASPSQGNASPLKKLRGCETASSKSGRSKKIEPRRFKVSTKNEFQSTISDRTWPAPDLKFIFPVAFRASVFDTPQNRSLPHLMLLEPSKISPIAVSKWWSRGRLKRLRALFNAFANQPMGTLRKPRFPGSRPLAGFPGLKSWFELEISLGCPFDESL